MKSKTVFVSGLFNVLHPGHIRLLRFAKECGERLIVAVYSDKIAANTAHVPQDLRLEGVQSNSWVDEAFIMNESIEEVIQRILPDIVVKGHEHEFTFNPERSVLEQYDGELLFSSGESVFSSVDLIRKEFYDSNSSAISLPDAYMHRHNIELKKLSSLLQSFSTIKVCVVGDLMVDEYITCQPLGMSQEDPTIVVTPIDTTRFIGGAGIVAAHAAGLGASVEFVTVAGDDSTRDFALDCVNAAGIKGHLLVDKSRPTTLKQRFRSKGKSLLRVSHLHQEAISASLQGQMLGKIEQALDNADLFVLSDFNYGCLPQSLVEKIIPMAKQRKMFMAADSQSSSQLGNISRFKEMDIITPTEREARISTRNHEDGLVIMAEQLRRESKAKNIIMKLGDEGLLMHVTNERDSGWLTDRIGALNSAPKDTAGAGDSLLITSALAQACGSSIWEAACLGSLAAAIQVGRTGNLPLRSIELLQELT